MCGSHVACPRTEVTIGAVRENPQSRGFFPSRDPTRREMVTFSHPQSRHGTAARPAESHHRAARESKGNPCGCAHYRGNTPQPRTAGCRRYLSRGSVRSAQLFPIEVPPLRERVDDIPLLIWHFIDLFATVYGKAIETIATQNMAALQQYSWPGNVRELRNFVERAVIVASGPQLTIPFHAKAVAPDPGGTLVDAEKAHIRRVLERVLVGVFGESEAPPIGSACRQRHWSRAWRGSD